LNREVKYKNKVKMKIEYYVLQKGLHKYFQKLEVNNSVVCSGSVMKANLFDDKNIAVKFQRILMNDYNEEYQIIKI